MVWCCFVGCASCFTPPPTAKTTPDCTLSCKTISATEPSCQFTVNNTYRSIFFTKSTVPCQSSCQLCAKTTAAPCWWGSQWALCPLQCDPESWHCTEKRLWPSHQAKSGEIIPIQTHQCGFLFTVLRGSSGGKNSFFRCFISHQTTDADSPFLNLWKGWHSTGEILFQPV